MCTSTIHMNNALYCVRLLRHVWQLGRSAGADYAYLWTGACCTVDGHQQCFELGFAKICQGHPCLRHYEDVKLGRWRKDHNQQLALRICARRT